MKPQTTRIVLLPKRHTSRTFKPPNPSAIQRILILVLILTDTVTVTAISRLY